MAPIYSGVHTPGPWQIHADGRSVEAIDNKHNLPLTTVCIFPNPPFPRDVPNARLIAAAPELLAALQTLADRLVRSAEHLDKTDPHQAQNSRSMAIAARNAIAKATGAA